MKGLVCAYRALSDLYLQGSWIGEAIKKQGAPLLQDKGSYRLVYGVVEHEYLYEYRIARLTDKTPKAAVKILLKMGMYLLDDSSMPAYAAVNEIAETAKKVGKGGVTGFLNAVLRRYAAEGKNLFPSAPEERLSVDANLPLWLVKRYEMELGAEEAKRRLTTPRTSKTHLRPARSFGKAALAAVLKERGVAFTETEHGFYVGAVGALADLIEQGKATVMSYGSIEIAEALPYAGGKILDLCAAPGGKSVYLAEKFGAEVIACDLYEHRVALIRSYAKRMKVATVKAQCSDGTILREEWKNAFGSLLLDAPCSGLGSLASNPDVALNRTEEGLNEITEAQERFLAVAGEYVAEGGALLYATCSDLSSENGEIVRSFLKQNQAFSLEKEVYTDPQAGGGESYYYALLWKKKSC